MASFIAVLIFFSFFAYQSWSAADTISHKKFLRDGDTIVSDGEVYALGFFRSSNSPQRYVGIWYNNDPQRTVVWVANRDAPIHNSSSAVVKVDERGNLAITNGYSSNPVWSNNVSVPISPTINSSTLLYKLLDSGNLVLRDENMGGILWQIFDFPTDTYLPGMKIGWSLRSGLNWSFTYWKSPADPSTGDFTLSMDPTESPELVIKKGSQKIWRSGPWTGYVWNGVPGMRRVPSLVTVSERPK